MRSAHRRKVKAISFIELNLLLVHHLIECRIQRAAIGALDCTRHCQKYGPGEFFRALCVHE